SVSALNQDSVILSGGVLSLTGQSLTNQATEVQLATRRNGESISYGKTGTRCNTLHTSCWNIHGWRDPEAYAETIYHGAELGILRQESNTATISTGSGINLSSSLQLPGGGQGSSGGNALFQPSQPGSTYLIETDPTFTRYREWLGSDYLLEAMGADPSTTQKRLGDGFYEQRLIREQVMELTGQRYLG
ncbi:hypothetical protein ACQV5M_20635, partial [Leptospira sp. SA-E8]|uniref:hypothetical protein n=1 Tax=Leptospira sp. SA-E8 TaxID=3422259 RepID=UPI003EB78E57